MPKDKKGNSLIIQMEVIIFLTKKLNDFYKFKFPLIKSIFNFTVNNLITNFDLFQEHNQNV